MKKYVFVVVIGVLCARPGLAVTEWDANNCKEANGGVFVTVGGTKFCKSSSALNWWSAYAWCQAMGGYMPSIKELCPDVSELIRYSICRQTYVEGAWSSTPVSSDSKMWSFSHAGTRVTPEKARDSAGVVYCLPNGTVNN